MQTGTSAPRCPEFDGLGVCQALWFFLGALAITVKFQYPLPLLSDLFARIKGASWFTKIDLRGAYNLVRTKQGDEWKIAFNTPEGHFEYLVMPFGLSNAPSVFQSFMHDIFREYLDRFMIVYLDDILVFSDDWESHVKQVEVDASEIGAGAVLSQRSSDGSVMKPCAFFSRKFSPAERNYDVGNRELLAMNPVGFVLGLSPAVLVPVGAFALAGPEEALDAYFHGFYFRSPCLSKDVGHLGGQVEPSDCPGVDTVVDRLQQIWTHVVDNLTLSQDKAQRVANRRPCVGPRLRVGDLGWLSSCHVPMKVSSPKFKPRFIGPYKISEVLNPVSFRLDLPASFAIHNVFHRSLLRRYVAPMVPSVDPPAPVLVEGELEYVVEKILDSRISRRKLQYLVKWKGYGQEDNSWVFASDVHAADLVRAFHLARPDRPGGSGEGSVTPPQGGGTVVNSVFGLPPVVMNGTSASSVHGLPLVAVSGAAASEVPSTDIRVLLDTAVDMDIQALCSSMDNLVVYVQKIQDTIDQKSMLEPRIPIPDLFFGDRTKFLSFRNNCKLFLALKPHSSGNPIQQIGRRLRERKSVHHLAVLSESKPEPMQCDRTMTKVERQEHRRLNRLCFYCGDSTHAISNCPKRTRRFDSSAVIGAALNLMDLDYAKRCGFFLEPLRCPIPLRGIDATPLAKNKPQYWAQLTMCMAPAHQEVIRFLGASWFTKIDLRGAYNLVRIRQGDEWKTAFNTPEGHFEYLVMPFGLANAPSVFQSFMHDIFREYLDKFLIVYLDDILIFSDDWESHVKQVEVDASEIGAGAVLSQRGSGCSVFKPCAFFSRKFSAAERNYDVGNRELLAMKWAFEEWRHWLEGAKHRVVVLTDHKNLTYLESAKRLNPRQARWSLFFARFDFVISYLPGSKNVKADALSRSFVPDSPGLSEPASILKEGVIVSAISPDLRRVLQKFQANKPDRCPAKKLFVPDRWTSKVISELHCSVLAGHPGIFGTRELVARSFWWPSLSRDVRAFVQSCGICARAKPCCSRASGLLLPLPVPKRPWTHISMDFISDLPVSQKMSVIWVVCDRFSKMVHLVPLVKLPSSSDLVPLFFQHVVRLHGIPENIVSDRGSQFVSRFWRAFCGRMGIDLSFSSAFHPQTNGQTERTNQTLETYLRCFVSADQDDWVSFLPLAEFALNNRASSATLVSPFFCNSGFHPRFSSGQVESSDCPGVDSVVDRLQQIWTQVVDNLTLSQEKAQLFANRRRRVGPRLRVGDLVWLSSRHIPMKVSSPKFKPRFIGPYRISEILNPVSFRLTLPDSFSIHNVFHRSLLRRYVAPMVPSVEPPAPVLVEGELEYIVEKILDSRVSRRKLQYLVKWKGYAQEDNSWVFASDVHAPDLVRAFHVAHAGRPGGSGEGSVTPPQGGGTVVNSVAEFTSVVTSGIAVSGLPPSGVLVSSLAALLFSST
ncbi:unnamed protein product [Ranitomeya imitator]|uniref:Gypsy retrotransposon integrase-like protein 1 n=1 Tax=Ranitomeya imitator TaxID=111125 RepID=A0ABN9LXC9_9NEOB|nr:unnamed protein product [Ranitomeya imitator]